MPEAGTTEHGRHRLAQQTPPTGSEALLDHRRDREREGGPGDRERRTAGESGVPSVHQDAEAI